MISGQKAIWKYKAGETVNFGSYYGEKEVTVIDINGDYITVETEDGNRILAMPGSVREL